MPRAQVGAGFVIGTFERPVVGAIRSHVGPGMAAYDIGASYGYHALFLSRLVEPGGVVFAFEPHPRDYALLCRNALANERKNLSALPLAVAERSGTVRFATFDYPGIGHIARPNTAADASFITVDAIALDDFVFRDDHPGPAFMKIDVEGGELGVFQGATRTLKAFKPIIVCEVWSAGRDEITRLMAAHGYSTIALSASRDMADVLFVPEGQRHP